MVTKQIKLIARAILPGSVYLWLTNVHRALRCEIPIGKVDLGDLLRLTPVSRKYGFDRGLPINRYYIENFLARNAGDIYGHVLEVGESDYTLIYGGEHIVKSDVLHVSEGSPQATIIADLTDAPHIPSRNFDCIILTQTLHLIYDVRSAVRTIYRVLKPGGVALVTIPGIDPILDEEWAHTWYWAFTNVSAERLFGEVFPLDHVQVEAWGNVLTATAFLQGLAAEELTKEQLNYRDPAYQVLVTVRAVKPE